jgi:FemAB-related protein (PEP-CTERM system-associated)
VIHTLLHSLHPVHTTTPIQTASSIHSNPPNAGPALSIQVSLDREPEAWNTFVLGHPEATHAHLWEWSDVIREVYGHRTHHLVARTETGIVGVLPLVEVRSRIFGASLCSMPYLDSGGVLATTGAAWSGLVEAACELAARLRIRRVELRHAVLPRLGVPARQDKVTLVLGLQADPERLWKSVPSPRQRQVRKAEREGITILRSGGDGIRAFYRVWSVNMRDLGSPAHDRRWFERLFAQFGSGAACYLAQRQGEVIGGLVTLEFQKTVMVPWASSDRRYFALSPNHLLYWNVIRDAGTRGFEVFDFGRSSLGSGTYQFKRQWGATEARLYWQGIDPGAPSSERPLLAAGESPPPLPSEPELTSRARAEQLWKRLPVPVATWLGSRLRGGITL